MKKETNCDISLTRTETLYLLKPDKYGKSISDNHNIGIMCKEKSSLLAYRRNRYYRV